METRNLPIGIQDFEYLRKNGFVYIDKTASVYRMASVGKPYFLGRPRRFGKSLLVSTLKAYFEGRRDLFDASGGRSALAVAALEKDWETYPVFHIDLSISGYRGIKDLEIALDTALGFLEERWGRTEAPSNLPSRFMKLIHRAAAATGKGVVVLIDEYDRPLIQTLEDNLLQDEIRAALKGFYGVLKAADPYLRFVLLTGVTKFSKVSIFSDLNQLLDISMNKDFAGICGITEPELLAGFGPEIQALADEQKMSFDETLAEMRKRYDGYCFAPGAERVYNPFSVINTLFSRQFGYYWFRTGTPTFLIEQMKAMHFDIPDFTAGVSIAPQSIDDYRAKGDNLVPLLYQTGYLTIKDFSMRFPKFILGFPNEEVKYAFLEELLESYRPKAPNFLKLSTLDFAEDLDDVRIDDFVKRLKALIEAIPYDTKAEETEHYFHTIAFILFTLMGQYSQAEVHSHHGRCDAVIIVPQAVYVFEFKIFSSAAAGEKAAGTALEQIDKKDYLGPYRAGGKRLFKIGAAYNTAERKLGEVAVLEE